MYDRFIAVMGHDKSECTVFFCRFMQCRFRLPAPQECAQHLGLIFVVHCYRIVVAGFPELVSAVDVTVSFCISKSSEVWMPLL